MKTHWDRDRVTKKHGPSPLMFESREIQKITGDEDNKSPFMVYFVDGEEMEVVGSKGLCTEIGPGFTNEKPIWALKIYEK